MNWFVRPHPRSGWIVCTPLGTQAAVEDGKQEAIAKAERMLGDEGGGELLVVSSDDTAPEYRRVAPSLLPYQLGRPVG